MLKYHLARGMLELKQKVNENRQKLQQQRRPGSEAANVGKQAARKAAELAKGSAQDPNIETSSGAGPEHGITRQEIARRAENAARARPPVDADLSPVGNPRGLEAFARADTGEKVGPETDAAAGGLIDFGSYSDGAGSQADEAPIAMLSPDMSGGDGGQEGHALNFDDAFGAAAGDSNDNGGLL